MHQFVGLENLSTCCCSGDGSVGLVLRGHRAGTCPSFLHFPQNGGLRQSRFLCPGSPHLQHTCVVSVGLTFLDCFIPRPSLLFDFLGHCGDVVSWSCACGGVICDVASMMRVSGAKLACCDSLGGGATVAMFLGGTEGDCVFLCCSTAAWFTYGVCGIVGTGIGMDGVCTLGCVLLQSCVGS